MSVRLAKTAGYCFGVSRAVRLVEQAAARGPVVTLGSIIHNRLVVDKLAQQGVRVIDRPEQAPPGATVVIRAHGVPRTVMEQLHRQGNQVIDATCPYVKRIHRIVAKASTQGRQCIILGAPDHPEVTAIAGWGESCIIVEDEKKLADTLRDFGEINKKPLTFVCQTTSLGEIQARCAKIIKKQCTNAEIFDTICYATENRQSEARQLAEQCSAMVVVGDRHSANTRHLAEICREHCARVALIEQADELPDELRNASFPIGVTAGASTPAWIIKEVIGNMSDEIKNETAQTEDFAELLEQSIKTINTGEKVTGVVTGIAGTEVYVDLGTKHAGYIPTSEISDDPAVKAADVFHVGDEIEVYVIRVNDAEGTVMLSKKRLDAMKMWDEVEAAYENKTPVEGIITEQNKGGLVASVKGVRVFIPASQTGVPKDGDMSTMLRKTVKMRITEVNRSRRRVVGSIRAVASEERRAATEKIWSEIEVGKKYHGVVKSLTSYGAFVDIGGVDGMVHVSELSWSRIKNPAEVVKVGDEIDVFVIALDPEKKKISLGYKTPEMNPWNIFMNTYKVGDVVKAKIVKLMTFGAFAEIIPGVDGLIHISQIADRRIGKPEDVLAEGQEVEVKIIGIDADAKRISLSIRALLTGDEPEQAEEPAEAEDAVVYSTENPQPVEE